MCNKFCFVIFPNLFEVHIQFIHNSAPHSYKTFSLAGTAEGLEIWGKVKHFIEQVLLSQWERGYRTSCSAGPDYTPKMKRWRTRRESNQNPSHSVFLVSRAYCRLTWLQLFSNILGCRFFCRYVKVTRFKWNFDLFWNL